MMRDLSLFERLSKFPKVQPQSLKRDESLNRLRDLLWTLN